MPASHSSGQEKSDGQQANADAPPKHNTDALRRSFGLLQAWACRDRGNYNAERYQHDGKVFPNVVTASKYHDPQHHISHQRTGPKNHVKRHRNVEVERVIIADIWREEHDDESNIIAKGNHRLDREEFRCEYEAVASDEEELRERHKVAGAGVVSKTRNLWIARPNLILLVTQMTQMTQNFLIINNNQSNKPHNELEEHNVRAAAEKDAANSQRGFPVHYFPVDLKRQLISFRYLHKAVVHFNNFLFERVASLIMT